MELFPQSSSQSIEHLDNDSFVQLHLSKPSDAFLTSISDSRPLLAAIDDVRGRSKKVAYLLQYFAVLSHGAYSTSQTASITASTTHTLLLADMQERPSARPEPLYFVQHSRSRISCHPCDTQASFSPTAVGISIHPDDIRAYERSGRCVPWHAVDTVVQIVDNLDAPSTANLVECLLKARPDLTGAYFLLLDKTVGRMRVGWYDASGVHYSQQYSIGQSPEILERFVYSFYYPLPDHPLYDSTLHMETPGIMEPTTWRITAGEHTYSKAKLIFSGEVIGRRTNVFKCEEGGQVSIIKDAYLPQTQLASESSILQAVHSDGIVDAFVPVKSSITVQSAAGRPYTTLAAEDVAKHHRVLVKARLVLGASGVRLDNAKSVKDLCMAIFDANEGERFHVDNYPPHDLTYSGLPALRELSRKGIFHRDMSPGNVLMYPSHDIKWAVRQGPSPITQDVRYVKNVMANQPRYVADLFGALVSIQLSAGTIL